MQARLFEKMDAVASLVASGERDPNKVAALCSGLEGTELQAELSAISEQLSELASGQSEIKELLLQKSARKSSVDLAKQDKVSSYIDIACHTSTTDFGSKRHAHLYTPSRKHRSAR